MVGISFHVGSGCKDPTAYSRAIQYTRELFDYAKMFGYEFNLVDIGGGFPGYDDDGNTPFSEVIAQIFQHLH